MCVSDTPRLPQATGLHRDAQCQLLQRSRDGRLHEPHARSGQRGSIREHPPWPVGPDAHGCSALRSRHGHKHGGHASAGGLGHVSTSRHEQEGRGTLHAPRTHKLYTQQVGPRATHLVLLQVATANGWFFPRGSRLSRTWTCSRVGGSKKRTGDIP